jgi:hypothetical protein
MMPQPSAVHATPEATGAPGSSALRLHRFWLVVARVFWVLLFLLNLGWFVLALIARVSGLEHPCSGQACLLTPAQAVTLYQLGIGLDTFAAASVGIPTLIVLAGVLLALLLFLRRVDDPMALVVGLFLLYPISTFAYGPNNVAQPLGFLPLYLADTIVFYAVFLIFPDGRFVPRWSWLLLAVWTAQHLILIVVTQLGLQPPAVAGTTYPLLYLSALAVLIYRFRRVSTARQRQQTKWVVLGVAAALLANIAYWIVLPIVIPAWQQPGSLYDLVGFRLYEMVTLALPVSFAVAIQRNQLFDVDALIKRTLVYGTLTAILVAIYFGMVIGAQALGEHLAREMSPPAWVIVGTTLVIAALFNPLRHRIQAFIDRRFYRSKYDVARTLEAFAATLRTDLELAELSTHLMDVVRKTMQPDHVSLWLRDAASARIAQSGEDGTLSASIDA